MKKWHFVAFGFFGIVLGLLIAYLALQGANKLQEMYPLPVLKCYTTSPVERPEPKPHPMKGTFEHEVKLTE